MLCQCAPEGIHWTDDSRRVRCATPRNPETKTRGTARSSSGRPRRRTKNQYLDNERLKWPRKGLGPAMRLLKGALFVGILAILVFGLPAVLASEEPTVAGESFSATAHSVGDNISGDSSATGTKTAADAEDPNSGERGTEPHTFLDWTATTFLNLLPKEYSLFPFVRSLLALPSRLPYELKLQPPFLFNRHSKYSPHLNEPFLPPPNASKGFVLVLEAKGGSDKMPAWHRHAGRRPDTVAIANALVRRGWTPVVWQYEDRTKDALEDLARTGNGLADLVANLSSREPGPPFDALVWRVNPQSHEPYTRSIVSIEELAVNLTPSAIPLLASHPKVMHTLGAKQGLYHLRSTGIGMSDTIRYTNAKELAEFAAVLAGSYNEGIAKMARARTELAKREVSESVRSPGFGGRVLKQNRGSQGEGVFVVRLAEPPHWAREGYPVWPAPDFEAMSLLSDKLPLDTMLSIQEASDNSIVNKTLGNFLTWMADLYLDPPGGSGSKEDRLIIDQRFLRRISEGEVRVVMVHETPQLVIHKVPSPASHGSISATLSSGAVHVPYLASSPDLPVKFSRLVAVLKNELPDIRKVLLGGKAEWPLLWTMDFIPRDRALANLTEGEEEEDWTLGEINASCPGLTTAPIEVFEAIAEALEQDILACRERQTRKEEGWFESIRRYWGWWTTVAAGAGSTSAPSGGGGTTATGSGN